MICNTYKLILLLLSLFTFHFSIIAQSEVQNDLNIVAFNLSYASQWPAGDLKDRFGNNLEVGLGVDFITKKRSFIFGIEGNLQFGNTVKEDVLAGITNEDGNIIGRDQGAAIVSLKQRGIYVGAHIGKIFPLIVSNKRSGIRITLGAGLLQHKIRLQDDLESVNIIAGDYKKGFDRLTNGLALEQFIGYQHLSKNRLLNFCIGFQIYEAFTKSRRTYDFSSMSVMDETRSDLLYGVKLAWTLPLYLNLDPGEIYY